MLKAKSVDSEETRRHLHDAHNRVISVAAVQQHLHASAGLGSVEMLPYLSTLCGALTHSMIGDGQSISLKVIGEGGSSTCANAESLGLIVTELVINALKHAFDEKTKDGQITVEYDVSGTDWKLSVADNGMERPDGVFAQPKSGLGTGIVGYSRHICGPGSIRWRRSNSLAEAPGSPETCMYVCFRRGRGISGNRVSG